VNKSASILAADLNHLGLVLHPLARNLLQRNKEKETIAKKINST
jgi:hypothetical protein